MHALSPNVCTRIFELAMLDADTGKAVTRRITATGSIDVERQKSGFVRRGFTVYLSHEIKEPS